MAGKTTDPETPEGTDPPAESNPEEDAFWTKLDERIKTGVGTAIDNKLKEFRDNSNSRTGRNTLPGFISDFMFGKATEKK